MTDIDLRPGNILCSQAAEIKEVGADKRVPIRPKPQKTKLARKISLMPGP